MVLLWITRVFIDVARFSDFHCDGTVRYWVERLIIALHIQMRDMLDISRI